MKKIVSVVLICLLLMAAALADVERLVEPGVFTEEEAAPFTGEWYLTTITSEGSGITPESMGFIGHLMLYPDGTGKMIVGTTVMDEVWYKDGDSIMMGEGLGYDTPMYITENGDLYTGDETASMLFTRRYMEDDPAILLDAKPADFKGDWVLTRVMKGKNAYTPEQLECEMKVTMKKNKYISSTNGKKNEGKLTQAAYSMTNAETRFVLHEDGTMSCENNSFLLWFEKQ